MKHKISAEVHTELLQLAKTLPQAQHMDEHGKLRYKTEIRKIKGCDLKEDERKLIKGTIRPNVRYGIIFRVPMMVNHEQNIINIYKHDGRDGVNTYVQFWEEEFKRAQEEKAAELASKNTENDAKVLDLAKNSSAENQTED